MLESYEDSSTVCSSSCCTLGLGTLWDIMPFLCWATLTKGTKFSLSIVHHGRVKQCRYVTHDKRVVVPVKYVYLYAFKVVE